MQLRQRVSPTVCLGVFALREPQNSGPQRNPQCDQKVAGIFGGEGAVSTASGFEPPGLASKYPGYRGDVAGANGQVYPGHLTYSAHIYGSADGTGYQSLYLNGGYDPEFKRYDISVTVIYSSGATETKKNPTLDEYQQLTTGYLPDSGTTDLEHNTVTVFGGAEYFVSPQNTLTADQKTFVQEGINRASELFGVQRCKDFINSLLQRAAAVVKGHRWGASDNFASNSDGVFSGVDGALALWTYQDAVYQGRVTASGARGVKGASIVYGNTTGTAVSWNNEFFNLNRNQAGLHTLHESLHQLPGFDDQTLANAARFVSNEDERDFSRDTDPIGAASQDLNRLIKDHCAP